MARGVSDIGKVTVVRGDVFNFLIELSDAYSDVLENPGDYTSNLVFRELQDDSLTPYLSMAATTETDEDATAGDAKIWYSFSATAAETQALPEYNHVLYCELVYQPPIVPPANPPAEPMRLFNGTVNIKD